MNFLLLYFRQCSHNFLCLSFCLLFATNGCLYIGEIWLVLFFYECNPSFLLPMETLCLLFFFSFFLSLVSLEPLPPPLLWSFHLFTSIDFFCLRFSMPYRHSNCHIKILLFTPYTFSHYFSFLYFFLSLLSSSLLFPSLYFLPLFYFSSSLIFFFLSFFFICFIFFISFIFFLSFLFIFFPSLSSSSLYFSPLLIFFLFSSPPYPLPLFIFSSPYFLFIFFPSLSSSSLYFSPLLISFSCPSQKGLACLFIDLEWPGSLTSPCHCVTCPLLRGCGHTNDGLQLPLAFQLMYPREGHF